MKKLAFEKFKNSMVSSSEMLRAITGGYYGNGMGEDEVCGKACDTVLNCDAGDSCDRCPAGIPGNGCHRR